jgi:hypothetical protein
MNVIAILATQFRNAIEAAIDAGELHDEQLLRDFPCRSCGIASDLLAAYFLENGIRTWYVDAAHRKGSFMNTQNHAWLITDDGTIVDITGDQFKHFPKFMNYNESVYIGKTDTFHRLFQYDERNVSEVKSLESLSPKNQRAYQTIISYL